MADFKGFAGNSEQRLRQVFSWLFKQDATGRATDGVLDPMGNGLSLKVSQTSTASAGVDVYRGMAVVQDAITDGVTPLLRDTTATLDILTASPMGATPRNDIVAFDAATGTVKNFPGAPNAVPVDPTIPASAVPLARLRHAASAMTVPSSKIDDLRVFTTLGYTETGMVANVLSSGLKRVGWGTIATANFSGGDCTVTHGLGFTPSNIQLTADISATLYTLGLKTGTTPTGTQFTARMVTQSGLYTGPLGNLRWVAYE